MNATVADFIIGNVWSLPISSDVANDIQAIPISDSTAFCLTLGDSNEGSFSQFVMEFYKDCPPCVWADFLWHKGCASHFFVFAWLGIMGGLKTADMILKRNVLVASICYLCHSKNESIPHLFFE
ncbi:hypothetical protein MA16_Dca009677 [Dendrobium catenatum]|uniref:Reverse transcriptase zinc-binding domain-containing protein n=1 Tax=Dendrobium catenatum TaxID=906689 RepID=A0A2I0VSP6_9ASPA|nr:hypothetical protein MA16_Dca009677 [Dendrobium catenatum]